MAWQPNPLMAGFAQGADGEAPWNAIAPGGARGPLTLDPQGVALGQTFQAVKDAIEAQQQSSVEQGYWTGGGLLEGGHPTARGLGNAADQYGQALLLGTPGTKGGGLPTLSRAAPEPSPGFTIYHGSPHEFAPTPRNPLGEFDPTKAGTGEGTQVYGAGAAYGAEAEAVAQRYRKLTAGPRSDYTGELTPEFRAALKAEDHLGFDRPSDAIEAMETFPDWRELWDIKNPDALAAHFDAHQQAKYGGQGHMYEVNVAADPERFLHWDTPISHQSDALQGVLKRNLGLADDAALPASISDMTGKQFYRALETTVGTEQASSILQEKYGIPGIRYRDQGGAPWHNVVVFDPATMEIIRRFGLAGLMAGGGAAALGGPNPGEQ